MPRHCKHKENRRRYEQRFIRREMRDGAVLGVEESLPSFIKTEPPSEEADLDWLDKYLDKPLTELSHWRRQSYKPNKYDSPAATTSKKTETVYHMCAKHGRVPMQLVEHPVEPVSERQMDTERSMGYTDSQMSRSTYGGRYDGIRINLLEYVPKVIEGVQKLVEMGNKYSRIASTILSLLFLWWLSFQLQGWLTTGAASLVRFAHPMAHYSSVTLEQFANRLRSFATSADDLIEGFYCDFSRSWCHRFDIMCDVKCSFMDKAIQRLRSA